MVTLAASFLGVCLTFLITFQGTEACAELTLRDEAGNVSSPNFPQQYFPNTCTVWTVQIPFGSVLTLSFHYLDLPQEDRDGQCHSSYVEIGSQGHETRVCGRGTKSFTSNAGVREFFIKFISGPIPLGRGFQLAYVVGSRYTDYCDYNQYHCRYGKCIPDTWRCNGIKECERGDDEHYCPVIRRPETPPPLTEKQTSPTPAASSVYPNTSHGCSHVLHNRTGQFKLLVSADAAYKTCTWLIDVPGDVDKIRLQFLRLDIYSDAYIWVYKGKQANISNCLRRFDGRSKLQTVTAQSSSLFVEFRLAFDNPAVLSRDLYFVARYTALSSRYYPDEADREPCYHQLFLQSGNFSMPARPFQDSSIRTCSWHIYKPYAGSYIHLLISNLDLQSGETIKVYDGHDSRATRLALIQSGHHVRLPVSVRSSGSHMLVLFVSPHRRNYTASRWVAFSAKYHFEDKCGVDGELHCGSKDNKCYRPSQRCDGIWDCPLSGADEEQCYGCPEHTYSCGSFGNGQGTKCYFRHDRCSGASVCPNDADELNCNEELCSESHNLFLCANKRCILYNFICDETDDCGDYSDEEGCSLGNSRKVMVAAVVGSLLCSLLLVLSLGCACKFYYLRHHHHNHNHNHSHRGPRYNTPLSRLQAEMFRRRAPPPPYHEAMLTSRPYDEAVREYLAQTQQSREPEAAEPESGSAEQGSSGNEGGGGGGGDSSVQNLISLMDFSEQGGESLEHSARLELLHLASDSSSDSDSDGDDDDDNNNSAGPRPRRLAEDRAGQIEMTETLPRTSAAVGVASPDESLPDVSEDSASATLSADDDGTEMTSLAEEGGGDTGKVGEERGPVAEESDKENNSDADSVCILCLDEEDSATLDDGTDTRCLLQDV